ncbi:uncharacterized protein YndB with AHSA1/START domain [Nocardia transvalensis]|uniref:Uncharacterized protein YndB with AHSA1/START domain n=1 Tax=Nocardia transvalensis TaxID=37333 RepID=A0A7W9PLE6_9NOCA|nr:SRPBCC domain-containing protein [Nocardia transvalensis]MBB5918311.1 uncharacterized protein YndB with AHSA1/START domain [Nocardia transvalensis]
MSHTESLNATITVAHTPEEVFAAVTDVRGWWSANIIGATAAPHDEFVFTDDCEYPGEAVRADKGIRFCRFLVTEADPGRRVVWHVVDAYLSFIADHDEWTGTDVVFDIAATPDGTTLRFVHEGLTAAGSECFDACSRGWTFYITKSLPQLLATGTGEPIARYRA